MQYSYQIQKNTNTAFPEISHQKGVIE